MHEQDQAAQMPVNVCRIPSEALVSEGLVPVLVEFREPPVVLYRTQHPLATAAQLQAYEQGLRATHRSFVRNLNSGGMTCRVSSGRAVQACEAGQSEVILDHDFTHLFNGVGLLVPGSRVVELAQHPQVKMVTGNHERPYLNRSDSIPFIGAPAVWQRRDAGGHPCDGAGVVIAIIDTGMAG